MSHRIGPCMHMEVFRPILPYLLGDYKTDGSSDGSDGSDGNAAREHDNSYLILAFESKWLEGGFSGDRTGTSGDQTGTFRRSNGDFQAVGLGLSGGLTVTSGDQTLTSCYQTVDFRRPDSGFQATITRKWSLFFIKT